jgi:UDP-N-acetylmuramoyl-tripeptide--D-alanyl-D-alanine ligase
MSGAMTTASTAGAGSTEPMATLAELHALLPGSTLIGDGTTPVARVHSDTRTLRPGDLFVALRGERFDAHDFLPEARAAGAVAALAERGLADAGLPGLQVADALAGLQQLAAAWRARFAALPLVAVAGSNGKTTVTQMVAAILAAWHGDGGALATAGNFNNHIGVPLTLLRLRAAHRAAVLELGMNHPGEIALLARMCAPTVALINNAQREHQEFMASVEAVARENGSVIDALPAGGSVVVPAADAYAPLWRGMAGARRVLTFGLHDHATAGDVLASAVWDGGHWHITLRTPQGAVATTLAQAGRHNALNAAAAAAAALAAGAPLDAIARGIAAFRPVSGRSALLTAQLHGQPIALVDDSYNANPDSVLAAIDVLAALPAPRWLLLGDMGEVGSSGPRFHAEVGERVRAAGIEHFWAAGALSAHAAPGRHFADTAALVAAVRAEAPRAASVLVKGSRFMKMEQAVRAVQEHDSPTGAGHAA